MPKVVEVDMTKSEFIGKIGNELWKFAGRCREKSLRLRFVKTRSGFRLYIKAASGWHKIFIGKNHIEFLYCRYFFFADRRISYYIWDVRDDHEDVFAYFVADLKGYYKALFPGKNVDPKCFNYNLQGYLMQKYVERIYGE